MNIGLGVRALNALCAALLSGCTLFSPVTMDTTTSMLVDIPHDPPSAATLGRCRSQTSATPAGMWRSMAHR
jgi:hypothetical protein